MAPFLILLALAARAQQPPTPSTFVDLNHDGINDGFVDANGDGVNDVDGKPYAHHFGYADADGDGINDLWTDADGDGVNDRLGALLRSRSRQMDRDGDGILETVPGRLSGKELMTHVLDADGDGRNDITGLAYNGQSLQGYRYGRVDEESGVEDDEFVDENQDGMNDRFKAPTSTRGLGPGGVDRFLDTDGDGMADDRGLGGLRGRGQRRGKK